MGTFQTLPTVFPGGTSDYFTTPFPIALGTKARDNAGNEFVLCFTAAVATVAPEQCVMIGADYSLIPVVASGRGPVGVVADHTKSGNTSAPVSPIPIQTSVWVQVYGRAFVQVNAGGTAEGAAWTSLLTSASLQLRIPTTLAASPPGQLSFTSDSNQLTTIQQYNIVGMTLATDATNTDATAITSVEKTHGGMRMPVWLNYPYVNATQRGASDG